MPNPPSHIDLGALLNEVRQRFAILNLQNVRLRQRVYGLEAVASLRDAGRSPAFPVEFRSQFGEDLLAWDILNRPFDGFFVEVGAFDGFDFSVSYGLESVGWKGLLVEAIPERFRQCEARRPGSRVVHAALSYPGAPAEAEMVITDDPHGGMLSHLSNVPAHLRAAKDGNHATTRVRVPVTTISELLKDHVGDVHLAVIDVEGAELDVLRGFDLPRLRPQVLLVEDNSAGRDTAVNTYMTSHNYTDSGWIDFSRIYIRSDLTDVRHRMHTATG